MTKEMKSPIFKTEKTISNMRIETIVVPETSVREYLKGAQLTESAQKKAVHDLVDRTPQWLTLTDEQQKAAIVMAMTQETVLYKLIESGEIGEKCDYYEAEFDKEDSLIVTAYYTTVNRKLRRALEKQTKEERARQERMDQAINILAQNESIIKLAKKRMEEKGIQPKKGE